MLQRLSLLKSAIQLYAADHEIPVPTPNEWQLMDKVLRLLQPFFVTSSVAAKKKLVANSPCFHQSCQTLQHSTDILTNVTSRLQASTR